MPIKRVGRGFIEAVAEDGLRLLVRINAIQQASDVDEFREEAYLTVAGRTNLIRSSLDELKEVLEDDLAYRR